MVYEWEPHKDVCYQLYINERRPLEDIMVHMKNVYQFTPSKRAYQVQFSRWKFPTKQRMKHKDDRLVKRIHELWKKNVPQSEMLRILTDEDGFDINSRELMRVRARNRWLLRVRNGDRARAGDVEKGDETLENDAPLDGEGDVTASLPDQEPRSLDQASSESPANSLQQEPAPAPATHKPRKISKRQSRRNRQHLSESEHIVRFPSEMTLNDSKEALNLDATTYLDIRECFARICQEESIVKKTLAGPGRWDYAKNRLIHERPHLQQSLWISKDDIQRKQLALDIICTDVTKRLRNQETKMTLVDAKNELGLNPEESHEIRAALHEVLCDANFTCKSDGTPEQWEELKKRWLEKSERLRALPLHGDDEQSRRKAKAVEIVARDVIKRRRDEKRSKTVKGSETSKRKDTVQHNPQNVEPLLKAHDLQQPTHQCQVQQARQNPSDFSMPECGARRSSSPASPVVMDNGMMHDDGMDNTGGSTRQPVPAPQTPPPERPVQIPLQTSNLSASHGILPQPHRMLGSSATANVPMNTQYGPSMYLGNQSQANYMEQQYVPHQFSTPAPSTMFQAVPAVSASFAAFLRLHPSSTYVTSTSLWIATLSSQSIQELRQAAVTKFPGACCVRIEGIIKDPKGNELPLQIQGDDELGAYFAHAQGGPPTFVVQLA
ncbi:hypothetical protein F53441_5892 [Fusarium austroafricanum]|uniref:Clr5 domain-containing protein n=1 Tax=Fusarium austroafricanum TaxID=2364996 RepID=A0A8H4KJ43_9HYPO|nr:hypothetical protein F53441_5892 [Fusarium austroafricanum]